MKNLRYLIEAALLSLLMSIFKIMPARMASNLGGWIGRSVGPRLAASRKALRNIERALPDLSAEEQARAIKGMWDHLGRVMAEYPHLETLSRDYTKIIGRDILDKALAHEGGAIFIGAHFGGWEINAPAVLTQTGTAIDISYRAPNNPHSDRLLMKARSMGGRIKGHAKSRQGGKAMMETIKNGGGLGILIDQKYREGVAAKFFGMEAMTNPFFIQLAQKYGAMVVPIRNTRLEDGTFTLTLYEPLDVFDESGAPKPVADVIAEAHALLEEWITKHPEQWLWLHRRWKD